MVGVECQFISWYLAAGYTHTYTELILQLLGTCTCIMDVDHTEVVVSLLSVDQGREVGSFKSHCSVTVSIIMIVYSYVESLLMRYSQMYTHYTHTWHYIYIHTGA